MFRAIGQVAGVVATVAAFIPGGQVVAAVAAGVAAVANIGAALTAKKPRAQGSINDRLIGGSNPLPYLMGLAFAAGVQVCDEGYGGRVDKVDNPYSFTAAIYSCCGPCDGIDSYLVDWNTVAFPGGAATGYYNGFLYVDTQLGARPEATALAPQWGGCPNWGADYKLSSMLAVGWSAKFDKKGNVFAGGLPPLAIVGRGVWAYDPRLDDTFPGGSGPQRVADESTWAYTRNPALHAGTYAYGRWVNGKLVFGIDQGDAVDFGAVAAWANVCDANGWTVNGIIYEPGDRWNNLKKICAAGGGEPIPGPVIGFSWHAPRIALDIINAADLAPGPLGTTVAQAWAGRINTVRPKFRSPAHQWSDTPADAVGVAAFVTEDGEEKAEEIFYELVTDKDQTAELALYEIWRRREAGPFTVTVGPRLQAYRPGDTLTIGTDCELWPDAIDAMITKRSVDPATGYATFELIGETPSKHAAVLGATGSVPGAVAPPALGTSDGVLGSNGNPFGYGSALIGMSSTRAAGGSPLSASDTGGGCTISIAAHTRVYADKEVEVDADTLAVPSYSSTYYIYYDDADRVGGAVTYVATAVAAEATNTPTQPDRHYVGTIATPAMGGGDTGGSGGTPPGWDPDFPIP